jgi:hypothetical protein
MSLPAARVRSYGPHMRLSHQGEPGRFLIEGTYGPMQEGELERAKQWGAELR